MFQAYSTTSTTYTQDSLINFTNIKFEDERINYTTTKSLTIRSPGKYLVQFNGIGSSTTADTPFTIQLFNNNMAVPDAIATTTPADANELNSLSFNTIINVPRSCCVIDNRVTLSLIATSTATGTLTLANIVITKLR